MPSSVAQKYPIGGIWPLGKLTMTHGTPLQITSNVGSQEQSSPINIPPQSSVGRPLTSMVQQIVFSCPSSNTGDVFVQYGNFVEGDTNASTLAISKGTTQSIPSNNALVGGTIDPNSWYVDGTTSDVVFVYCVVM